MFSLISKRYTCLEENPTGRENYIYIYVKFSANWLLENVPPCAPRDISKRLRLFETILSFHSNKGQRRWKTGAQADAAGVIRKLFRALVNTETHVNQYLQHMITIYTVA